MDLIDLIFPKSCLGCGRQGIYICNQCIGIMPRIVAICPVCGKNSIDGLTHIRCKRKLGLDGLISIWPYEGIIRKAIISFKYKYTREVAKELSKYIFNEISQYRFTFPDRAILIPTPLYWYRENFRGFNQSDTFGKMIAENQGWDYNPDLLIRKRLKKSQTQLMGEERKENIHRVFSLNTNNKPQNTCYILFDDVYTTGSTLKEACKVLKRNGAKEVWGLTISR